MKHLSSAFTAIRRAPYQTGAALLILSITFFVGYSFSLFLYGAENILRYFETRPQITAFFKLDTPEEKISQLEKAMTEKNYVEKVTVISKEKALEIYREDNKNDPQLLELVTKDILPASIEVASKEVGSLSQIQNDLKQVPEVEEVVYQKDVVETLQLWTRSIRNFGLGSVAILACTSFLLIMIITGMKVVTKRRAIQIMRILGATKWYVNAPFIYEGIIYGVTGSVLGWCIMYVGVLYITPWLSNFLGTVPLLPFSPAVLAIQLGSGTLFGAFLGAFASIMAVRRMMRKVA